MKANHLMAKRDRILEAIASGRSCEQILASDRTLSYHDIFHAVTEVPTSYWDKAPGENTGKGSSQRPGSARTAARQRSD